MANESSLTQVAPIKSYLSPFVVSMLSYSKLAYTASTNEIFIFIRDSNAAKSTEITPTLSLTSMTELIY